MSDALNRRITEMMRDLEAEVERMDHGDLRRGWQITMVRRLREALLESHEEARSTELSQDQVLRLLDGMTSLTRSVAMLAEQMAHPIRLPYPESPSDSAGSRQQ